MPNIKLNLELNNVLDVMNYGISEIEEITADLEVLRDEVNEDSTPDLHETISDCLDGLEEMAFNMPDPYSIEYADYPLSFVRAECDAPLKERFASAVEAFKAVLEITENVLSNTEDMRDSLEDITGYEPLIFPE